MSKLVIEHDDGPDTEVEFPDPLLAQLRAVALAEHTCRGLLFWDGKVILLTNGRARWNSSGTHSN